MTGVAGVAAPVTGGLLELLEVLGPAAVKALGLLAAGWLVARLVGRRSAAVKHLVWIATLAGTLLLPAAEAGFPAALRLDAGPVAGAVVDGLQAAAGLLGVPEAAEPAAVEPGAEAAAGGAASGGPSPGAVAGSDGPVGGALLALAALAALAWLAGTTAVLVHTAWGLVRLARIRGRSTRLEEIGGVRASHLRRLAEDPSLEVRVSPEVSLPVVQGILRPTLLVPQEALDEWPADRTRAVLLHEAGHVRRRDFTSHLLARLACALYWFNPLVWWAAREARKEQERACDDVVLRAGHRPSSYARHLLTIAREGAGAPAMAGVSMAHWSDLEGRVMALLREDVDRSPARAGWLAGVAIPAAVLALGLGAVTLSGAEAEATGGTGGAVGAEDPVPRLVDALDHPEARVRKDAVHRLGELEEVSVVYSLERVMLEDESRRVRGAAAWAIGETESGRAVEVLRRALAATDGGEMRADIVRALGETERPEAVPVLADALEAPDRKIRWHALKALAENGTGEARTAFRRALEGRDPELREMARRVLEKRREKDRRDGKGKRKDRGRRR